MKWLIYGHSIKDAAEYEYVNTVISTAVEYDVELCVFRPYLDELIRYNPDVIQLAAVESSSDLITQRPDITPSHNSAERQWNTCSRNKSGQTWFFGQRRKKNHQKSSKTAYKQRIYHSIQIIAGIEVQSAPI